MRHTSYKKGFTLAELLVALIVSSVILAAVATLAFAMSSANDATDDTSSKQAQLRYATVRISDLIRHCRLIYATSSSDLAVWRADDDNDDLVDVNEIAYIRKGPDSNYLHMYEFPSSFGGTVSLDTMPAPVGDDVKLIPQCSNVEFYAHLDNPDDPVSKAKRITITFDLAENDIIHRYQISTALRGWAGNLLNEDGNALIGDDD